MARRYPQGRRGAHVSLAIEDSDLVRLVEAGPFESKQEVADFLACSPEEREGIIQSILSSGKVKTVDGWTEFLNVMGTILTVAAAVTGITGAILGVYTVAKL